MPSIRNGFARILAQVRGLDRDASPRRPDSRACRPDVSSLEGRVLRSSLPTAPTADEQYMLQLLNRARANPAAEGQRLIALTKSDPVLANAVKGWNLSTFLKQIDSVGPEAPLAFNTRLIAAALDHDQSMLAANAQTHAPSGFLVNGAGGLVAGDGQVYYPVGNTSWATGENVFAYSANVSVVSSTSFDDYFHEAFLIDWGNSDFGHLKNALAPSPSQSASKGQLPFSEVGIGILTGVTPTAPATANPENPANKGLNVGPALVTEEFGWHTGNAFLTGAIYRDNDANNFYTPGEGLGNVLVQAVGLHGEGTYQTLTWGSGGYSLALPPGSYTVTASGTNAPARAEVVTIGQDNVGWDVQYNGTTPAISSVAQTSQANAAPSTPLSRKAAAKARIAAARARLKAAKLAAAERRLELAQARKHRR